MNSLSLQHYVAVPQIRSTILALYKLVCMYENYKWHGTVTENTKNHLQSQPFNGLFSRTAWVSWH